MVTVYTTQTCTYCAMVKKYLDMKKVNYKTVDVTLDSETRGKLFEKTGMMTVPVIADDNDNYIVGWNPGKLMQFLDNAKPQAV